MRTIPVYILAGGESTRFGSDKARARLGGEPLLARAAEPLRERAESFTVVADRADRYADLGFRTIADLGRAPGEAGGGPLAGIASALDDLARRLRDDASVGEWAFVTACDFVGADPRWVDALIAGRPADPPTHRAVAFRGERWEPLFALYHVSFPEILADGPSADDLRTQGAVKLALDRADAAALPLPEDWSKARSIDTPERLAAVSEPDVIPESLT